MHPETDVLRSWNGDASAANAQMLVFKTHRRCLLQQQTHNKAAQPANLVANVHTAPPPPPPAASCYRPGRLEREMRLWERKVRLYAELTARDSAIVRQVFGVGTVSSSSSVEEGVWKHRFPGQRRHAGICHTHTRGSGA